MKKNQDIMIYAYKDPMSINTRLNLNLLQRIKRELGGEFIPNNFYHHPTYDPSTGETKSYLISRKDQSVQIKKLNTFFEFKKGESIFMEISQKYDDEMILNLAKGSGFRVKQNFYDSRRYFIDSLWQKE